MSTEMSEYWRDHRDYVKRRRAELGMDCPGCRKVQPKRIPTRLMPGQICKVCGYSRSMAEKHNLPASKRRWRWENTEESNASAE